MPSLRRVHRRCRRLSRRDRLSRRRFFSARWCQHCKGKQKKCTHGGLRSLGLFPYDRGSAMCRQPFLERSATSKAGPNRRALVGERTCGIRTNPWKIRSKLGSLVERAHHVPTVRFGVPFVEGTCLTSSSSARVATVLATSGVATLCLTNSSCFERRCCSSRASWAGERWWDNPRPQLRPLTSSDLSRRTPSSTSGETIQRGTTSIGHPSYRRIHMPLVEITTSI